MYALFSARFGTDWLQGGPANGGVVYASPAHPQVRSYLSAICRDLVGRYSVDGLHLTDLEFFALEQEAEAAPTPESPSIRQEALTTLLAEMRQAVAEVRPGVGLSVAVWPVNRDRWGWGVPEGYSDYGQDPRTWLDRGLVDVIVPQLSARPEFEGPDRVSTLVGEYVGLAGERMVVPALSGEAPSFLVLSRAISRARAAGAMGVAISGYRALGERRYWDDLAADPFARPASMPPMSWRGE